MTDDHDRANAVVDDWLVAIRPATVITSEHLPYLRVAIEEALKEVREETIASTERR
jgi:hypothetical protein